MAVWDGNGSKKSSPVLYATVTPSQDIVNWAWADLLERYLKQMTS